GATIPVRAIFVAAAGIALAFLAARLLDHTHVGKGLRGVTQDRTAAALAGVPIDRYLLVAFAAVGTLAAIAALIALPSTPISVDTGTLLGLKGLVAAAVARFSLPRAAMVAGVALGVVETAIANIHFAGFSSGPSLSDVIPFALLLAILVVRSLRTREVQTA
ncbi:MAG TPA: hypothetical protein VFK89_07665, partial [Actinomycetota bacterium]|nr:hypothetical protein [Actinomycetota bacterium]